MSQSNLSRLISPRSIAVVGHRGADFAIRESLKLGYTGQIWAIHPSRDTIEGLECFKSVRDLPEPPDATFIAVNAEAAIEIVADLNEIGGGGAVLYASGFGEVGEVGIAFNPAGTKMFIVGAAGNEVNVYNLSTGFDVSTAR